MIEQFIQEKMFIPSGNVLPQKIEAASNMLLYSKYNISFPDNIGS